MMLSTNTRITEKTSAVLNNFTNDGGDVELGGDTLTVKQAAELMGKTEQFVRIGLQRSVFPFGWAVMMGRQWSYFISRSKFEEYTGIKTKGKGGES